MTRRERLRRCYFHEEVDRPAVYSRTGFPADDPSYDRLKAYLRERTELKEGWSGISLVPEFPVSARDEPFSADFLRRTVTLRAPAGQLESSHLISRRGQPGLHETFFVKEPEDVRRYLSLPPARPAGEAASFFAADRQLGDRGIVEASLGFNPAGFAAELCGSATFALLSVTDRELIHALCRRRQEELFALVEALLAAGVGPFFSMLGEEYVVPPLHGPRDFRDFNVRYDRPLVERIHAAGGRVHIHSHGAIRKVFQGFVDLGADVLHPFEPPPMGDITPAEAKALARGRVCLEGNLQIDRMYEAEPEAIRAETRQLIQAAFDDRRGLIVSPSASPYIRGRGEECFPRYQAMVETVLGWDGN
jgi:hypothetical protein